MKNTLFTLASFFIAGFFIKNIAVSNASTVSSDKIKSNKADLAYNESQVNAFEFKVDTAQTKPAQIDSSTTYLALANTASKIEVKSFSETLNEETSKSSTLSSIVSGMSSVAKSMTIRKRNPDRGFYGSLGFTYWDEKVQNKSEYTQQSFLQEYKLGYMGNIYSPKLLDYTLEGILRYEELKNQQESETTTTKIDSQDYKANLKFIKSSKFPFIIYANKTDKPVTRVDSSSTYSYLYRTQNSGINGLMNFNLFTIDYSVVNADSLSEDINSLQDRKTQTYNVSLRHNGKSSNFKIGYKHREENVQREYTTATSSEPVYNETKQIDDSVNMQYNLDISEDLKFSSSAGYLETDYTTLQTNNANADFSLRWSPKSKHSASLSASGTRIESVYDTNTTQTVRDIFDSINIHQRYSYNITPTLTFTQSASDYIYENSTVSGDIKNFWLNLRHNYNKNYSNSTNLTLNTSLDGQLTDSQMYMKSDDTDNSTTTQRYTFNTRAGLTEQLPSMDSRLKIDADYYIMQQSNDESSQRITSNISLYSNLSSIFKNTLSAGVTKTDTTQVSYNAAEDSYNIKRTSSTMTTEISELLESSVRLGIKGNLKLRAGVMFSNTSYDDRSIQRTKPLVDLFLNYRFGRNLKYTGHAHVDRDTSYDYTNYSSTSTLSYIAGKTSILLSHKYYMTESGEYNRHSYGRTRFDATLVRKF